MAECRDNAVPDSDAGECPPGFRALNDEKKYSEAEWLDWNCRGYYLANGMEPPISQESMDARPALGITSELLTGVNHVKPEEMTAAAKAAAQPPIVLQDTLNSTENSGRAGNEPSDATENGADHISSVSVDKGKLADEPLAVGHKIFMSQDLSLIHI